MYVGLIPEKVMNYQERKTGRIWWKLVTLCGYTVSYHL